MASSSTAPAKAPPVMEVSFPGGMAVDAHFKGHVIHTDQPLAAGGGDTAPPPFDLFLASIGTCAGFYVARFCQRRSIATDELRITLEPIRDSDTGRFVRMKIDVHLPAEFPEKYTPVVARAVDQCAVKRTILDPPEFEVNVEIAAAEVVG